MSGTNTTTSAPTVPSFNSIFQSPGGPPLILVCIAAGLLLGAFLGILLMRRVRPVAVQRVHGLRGFPDPNKKLGEKPTLLDVHLVPRSDAHGVRGWDELYPFAALYLPSPNAPPAVNATSPSPAPTRVEAWRRRLLARIPSRLRPSSLRSHDPRASPKTQAGERTPPIREVQLAITVSMPTPRPRLDLAPPLPGAMGPPGAGKDKEKESRREQELEKEEEEEEKDPLSASVHVSTSAVNDSNDSPNEPPAPTLPHAPAHAYAHAKLSDDENPVPDCCIGTLVVAYRPPPELELEPAGTVATAP